MITHYDTLGVRPGDDDATIRQAYWDLTRGCIPSEPWIWTSMKWHAAIRKMQEYNEAFLIVGHADRRKPYNQKLRELLVICPLCDGTGKVPMGEKNMMGEYKQFMPCAPCGGTGKAEPPMEVKRV